MERPNVLYIYASIPSFSSDQLFFPFGITSLFGLNFQWAPQERTYVDSTFWSIQQHQNELSLIYSDIPTRTMP